jgi:hypothetical protein
MKKILFFVVLGFIVQGTGGAENILWYSNI